MASQWAEFLEGMVKPLLATAIVAVAVVLSYFQKLGLGWEMVYSIARSFLQLSIIGFVLQFIFTQKNVAWILAAYLFMIRGSLSATEPQQKATYRAVYTMCIRLLCYVWNSVTGLAEYGEYSASQIGQARLTFQPKLAVLWSAKFARVMVEFPVFVEFVKFCRDYVPF